MSIIIANIINLIAGLCSITSVQGKTKQQIVFIEFLGTALRISSNILVKSWSDLISKIIKFATQILTLKNKYNRKVFLITSILYFFVCLTITYITKDIRYLVALTPSIIEFYALLSPGAKKYRLYIIVTKTFWIINNLLFKLYVGIIFDLIVVIGHFIKINKKSLQKADE